MIIGPSPCHWQFERETGSSKRFHHSGDPCIVLLHRDHLLHLEDAAQKRLHLIVGAWRLFNDRLSDFGKLDSNFRIDGQCHQGRRS